MLAAIMLFLNYFYTDSFGLTPAMVGILLLSVRVVDAIIDPMMGPLLTGQPAAGDGFGPIYYGWRCPMLCLVS